MGKKRIELLSVVLIGHKCFLMACFWDIAQKPNIAHYAIVVVVVGRKCTVVICKHKNRIHAWLMQYFVSVPIFNKNYKIVSTQF